MNVADQEPALIPKFVWFNRVAFGNRIVCHGVLSNEQADLMWAWASRQPDIVWRISGGELWILFKVWLGNGRDWQSRVFRPRPTVWNDLPYLWMREQAQDPGRLMINPDNEV